MFNGALDPLTDVCAEVCFACCITTYLYFYDANCDIEFPTTCAFFSHANVRRLRTFMEYTYNNNAFMSENILWSFIGEFSVCLKMKRLVAAALNTFWGDLPCDICYES
jgi:hypothetical protein